MTDSMDYVGLEFNPYTYSCKCLYGNRKVPSNPVTDTVTWGIFLGLARGAISHVSDSIYAKCYAYDEFVVKVMPFEIRRLFDCKSSRRFSSHIISFFDLICAINRDGMMYHPHTLPWEWATVSVRMGKSLRRMALCQYPRNILNLNP